MSEILLVLARGRHVCLFVSVWTLQPIWIELRAQQHFTNWTFGAKPWASLILGEIALDVSKWQMIFDIERTVYIYCVAYYFFKSNKTWKRTELFWYFLFIFYAYCYTMAANQRVECISHERSDRKLNVLVYCKIIRFSRRLLCTSILVGWVQEVPTLDFTFHKPFLRLNQSFLEIYSYISM